MVERYSIILSVHMITYNHENYIAQAIDSILMQKTTFPFEIVIGEDCSTDKTREIVFEYAKKYSDIIKVITSYKNVGAINNFIRTLKACKGKYIAFCEGDDYWIDPYKLQKQVDFLEANPEYGLIHTDSLIFNEWKNNFIKSKNKKDKRIVKSGDIFVDLIRDNFIRTLTVVVRTELVNKALKCIGDKYYSFKMGDYPLWLEISKNCKIKYLNDITAVYRIHLNSSSWPKDINKQYEFIKSIYQVKFYFCKKYNLDQSVENYIKQNYYHYILSRSLSWGTKKFIDKNIYKNYKPITSKEKILFYASKNNILWNIGVKLYGITRGFGNPYFIKLD